MHRPILTSVFLALLNVSVTAWAGSIYEKNGVELQNGAVTCTKSGEIVFSDTFAASDVWKPEVENYQNLLKIQFDKEFLGTSTLFISGEGVPKTDTAWGVRSVPVPLPDAWKEKGSEFVLTVHFCTNVRLIGEMDPGDSYRNHLIWFDKDGNLCGKQQFSYISETSPTHFTEAQIYGTVPENAASFEIQLGFDRPNVDEGRFIAFRKISLALIPPDKPFQKKGLFVSEIIPEGGDFTWDAEMPEGTQVAFRISTADAAAEGRPGTWSPFCGPNNDQNAYFTEPFTIRAPFIRYEATLTPSKDGTRIPVLKNVSIRTKNGVRTEIPWKTRQDVFPPRVQIVSESPTKNTQIPLKIEIQDDAPIAWETFRASVDGADCTEKFVRSGNSVTMNPEATGWNEGLHSVSVEISDIYDNSVSANKCFLIGDVPTTPKVTLRDDGVTLIDGQPFFPIGIYGVMKREFNHFDFDEALAGLKAAGFNFAHSYSSPRTDEFLAAAEKYGFKLWCVAHEVDERFVNIERNHPAIIAWYLGDDTSDNTTPSELYDRDDAVKMVDPTRISVQADGVGAANRISKYEDYVLGTDAFLPEIYPVHKNDAECAEKCVAQVICDMKRTQADIANSGGAPRAVWPIIQYFQGWGWERFPTNQELRAMSFASLIYGANGITWYTYGGTVEPEKKKFNYGVTTSPERWENISILVTQIQTLSPVLLERTPTQPAPPEILSGPAKDALGNPSISVLVKKHEGNTYVFCVNSTPESVTACIVLPGLSEGEVLFENRTIQFRENVLKDEFQRFDVHIYKLTGTSD